MSMSRKVIGSPAMLAEVMTSGANLVTCAPGTDLEAAKDLLQTHKIEKLLVVDAEGRLHGLITFKDLQAASRHPQATRDERGRLVCGAAVGVGAGLSWGSYLLRFGDANGEDDA